MLTTVKGTYRDGKIHLNEDPHVIEETTVVVTFLEPVRVTSQSGAGKRMTFGMFADPSRRMSTLADFKVAEYDDSCGIVIDYVVDAHDAQVLATALMRQRAGRTVKLLSVDEAITLSGLVPTLW